MYKTVFISFQANALKLSKYLSYFLYAKKSASLGALASIGQPMKKLQIHNAKCIIQKRDKKNKNIYFILSIFWVL